MNKKLLEEYADLKTTIASLEKQAEKLKPEVLKELQNEGVDEVELSQRGTFSLVPKRKWKYPQPVVKMEEELKAAKTEAEAKGTATYEDASYVKFVAVKED